MAILYKDKECEVSAWCPLYFINHGLSNKNSIVCDTHCAWCHTLSDEDNIYECCATAQSAYSKLYAKEE